MIKVGSARSMSLGNDGSVSEQPFYIHPKGWLVIHARDKNHRHSMALDMRNACANNNLTYSQPQREEIYKRGTDAKVPTKCDCSSLVTQIIRECITCSMKNSTTYDLALNCKLTGLFDVYDYIDGKTKLWNGDILVTKIKGHTVIVTRGAKKNTKTSK